ncbi:MAG: hypothetical protein AAFU41_06555 [Pseudomonadota bacterium]
MNVKITEVWYKSGEPTDNTRAIAQRDGQSFRRAQTVTGPLNMSPTEMLHSFRNALGTAQGPEVSQNR